MKLMIKINTTPKTFTFLIGISKIIRLNKVIVKNSQVKIPDVIPNIKQAKKKAIIRKVKPTILDEFLFFCIQFRR